MVCFLLDKYSVKTKLNPDIVIVDGNWGAWASHGSCSRTCGGGEQQWNRECDDPAPEHGGAECTGNKTSMTTSCKTCHCPCNIGILFTEIPLYLDLLDHLTNSRSTILIFLCRLV